MHLIIKVMRAALYTGLQNFANKNALLGRFCFIRTLFLFCSLE